MVQEQIEAKLSAALKPLHLDVENESRKHHVPPGSETHFKIVIASSAFEGLSLVERHRQIHALLRAELAEGVHALALKTLTDREWEAQAGAIFKSPPCASGSKPKPPPG